MKTNGKHRQFVQAMLKGKAKPRSKAGQDWSHTLPPLEQWYVMLLHNGVLPGALAGRLNTAFTRSLVEDARLKCHGCVI